MPALVVRTTIDNGDNYSFNETIFNEVSAFYEEMSNISMPVAANAKYARVKEKAGRDPKFTYTAQQFVLSYGETALYLLTMVAQSLVSLH
jgi:hypothetical protein